MKTHKAWVTLFMLILFFTAYAQKTTKVSGISNPVYISIVKELPKPPYLEIRDYYFEDKDGNKKIDAEESTFIHFDLYNTGSGPGVGLEIQITESNNIKGLQFEKVIKLPDLKEKEQRHCSIPITGLSNLQTAKTLFTVEVREGNGFHSDPVQFEVATEAFREPMVKIVDYQVSSQSSGTLEKRKPFDLEVLVQNLGQGVANDVSVSMAFPMNVFCLSANEIEMVGKLEPGEKRLLSYNMVTNNEFTLPAIDISYSVKEKYGQFAEDRSIMLNMNQQVSGEKLVIEGISGQKVNIEVASLSSDVDRNIPESPLKNPMKVALIIGNENYSGLNAEINVNYARRDAETFRNYATRTLGVEERNLYFMTDATSGSMKRNIDLVVELVKRLGSEAELIFYYAGHGFPDERDQVPYLIPVDVNASDLTSAIPLREVYRKFSETNAKKITVLLDACFSGGGRNQGLLAARAVRIKPKEEAVSGNLVVFAASTGEQTALPYNDQKHGMFSYFLMKKLQETNGSASYGELYDFLKDKVGVESLRVNGKAQDPAIIYSPLLTETWKSLTF